MAVSPSDPTWSLQQTCELERTARPRRPASVQARSGHGRPAPDRRSPGTRRRRGSSRGAGRSCRPRSPIARAAAGSSSSRSTASATAPGSRWGTSIAVVAVVDGVLGAAVERPDDGLAVGVRLQIGQPEPLEGAAAVLGRMHEGVGTAVQRVEIGVVDDRPVMVACCWPGRAAAIVWRRPATYFRSWSSPDEVVVHVGVALADHAAALRGWCGTPCAA